MREERIPQVPECGATMVLHDEDGRNIVFVCGRPLGHSSKHADDAMVSALCDCSIAHNAAMMWDGDDRTEEEKAE